MNQDLVRMDEYGVPAVVDPGLLEIVDGATLDAVSGGRNIGCVDVGPINGACYDAMCANGTCVQIAC